MLHNSTGKHGHYYGIMPEKAAAKNSSTPLILDHDLDAVPEAGRRLTVAGLADHVDDLASRLWAAGVRPGAHVVVHKADNFDVWLLGIAAERTGAVPVMLSHHLDSASVGVLLGRLDKPYLVTDVRKLDGLA
ncbi:MAG: long-chain acyl-CoA synthetase, partial [Trebonia sp.]